MGTNIGGASNNPNRGKSNRIQPIDPIIKGEKPNNDQRGSQSFEQASFSSKRHSNESEDKIALVYNSKEDALNYIRKVLSNNSLVITNNNFEEILEAAKINLNKKSNSKDPSSVANYRSNLNQLSEAFKKLGFGKEDRDV